jgi:hypothetical protein
MRLLLYNIRYATGTGAAFHLPVPGAGYLRSNPRVLAGITRFIKGTDPDIVGLVEVDTGSIRTGASRRRLRLSRAASASTARISPFRGRQPNPGRHHHHLQPENGFCHLGL